MPSTTAAAVVGLLPTASTPAAQAALASLCPPYAAAGSTATRFPRSAHPCGGLAERQRKKSTRRVFAVAL